MSSLYSETTIAGFRSSGHWRDEVLVHYVDRWAEEDPDREVLTDGYSSLTTAQLRGSAYRFAAALVGIAASWFVGGQRTGDMLRYSAQSLFLVPVFVCAIRHPDWWPFRPLSWAWESDCCSAC